MEQLINNCEPGSEERKFLEAGSLTSIREHLEIIQQFGRYPSRNAILGRESTPEELEHLKKNPHGFSKPPEASAT